MIRDSGIFYLPGINRHAVSLPPHMAAQILQNICHAGHVPYGRDIHEDGHPLMKKGRRHHGEGGVFGTLYGYLPL